MAAASFSQLNVYKHDDPPFEEDPMSKCAQWSLNDRSKPALAISFLVAFIGLSSTGSIRCGTAPAG